VNRIAISELKVAVLRSLKDATQRIDGQALLFTLLALFAAAVFFGYEPEGIADRQRARLFWGSVVMIPIAVLLYRELLQLSVDRPYSRVINAVLLVTFPLWVYWALA
jgi:hypothetical protein